MNAIPPDFHTNGFSALGAVDAFGADNRVDDRVDGRAAHDRARLFARWTALAGAARVVAQLADLHEPAGLSPGLSGDLSTALTLPVSPEQALGGRRMLIEQGIDDMLAMMEPGLTALLDVQQRGGQTAPAAKALWQEFLRARRGLAALAPIRPMASIKPPA